MNDYKELRDALAAYSDAVSTCDPRKTRDAFDRLCVIADIPTILQLLADLDAARADAARLTAERDAGWARYYEARKELGALKFPDCTGTVKTMPVRDLKEQQ